MSAQDLDTLRWFVSDDDEIDIPETGYLDALSRVESRLAHLEEGLRRTVNSIDRYDAVLDPNPPSAEDLLWHIRDTARSLLADQDGAV